MPTDAELLSDRLESIALSAGKMAVHRLMPDGDESHDDVLPPASCSFPHRQPDDYRAKGIRHS
jgi:hypothetical protein